MDVGVGGRFRKLIHSLLTTFTAIGNDEDPRFRCLSRWISCVLLSIPISTFTLFRSPISVLD